MKTYVVLPDDVNDFMPVNDMLLPAYEFSKYGAICCTRKAFFDEGIISSVEQEDDVIIYITIKDEGHIQKFKNLRCRKILRNVDPAKSDGIKFKNDLALHEKVKFDCILVGVCSEENLNFLANKGVKTIKFPHVLDFSNQRDPDEIFSQKEADIILSGQQHEKFYPVRHRLNVYFANNQKDYRITFLPHPGFKISERRHQFIGEEYVNLVSKFWAGPVGTGHADGFHMKFLEFAKGYTLPIGNVPSFMDERAKKLVLQAGIDESDKEMDMMIRELFSDKDKLKERIINYSNIIKETNGLQSNVQRVFRMIKNRDYDEA